jgi:RNA polymerase sigma-70 factor (ECF subfamily)
MTIYRVSQSQDDLYQQAVTAYGAALQRLVGAYELDADRRRDLLQDIHLALWRSFETFEARCSLRTWVYRVAHNIATSHVIRQRRTNTRFLSLEQIESMPDQGHRTNETHLRMDVQRLLQLIHQLNPPDREVMLLYLEDLDAATIGEIMEMSAVNVRSKVHRIKTILTRRFNAGGQP